MTKSKNIIHKAEVYGELLDIPMSPTMNFISVSSLILQLILTVFAVHAFRSGAEIKALSGTGFASGYIYFAFPAVTWILSFAFRFACRAIPIDMWRFPIKVREGMKAGKGVLLKWMTLLMEIETVICFLYITAILYMGKEPSNMILLAWVLVLAGSVYITAERAASVKR